MTGHNESTDYAPAEYTRAGVITAVCADLLTRVIDRITREGFNEDEDVADLVTVARAMAKLAHEEGVPADEIITLPADQPAQMAVERAAWEIYP